MSHTHSFKEVTAFGDTERHYRCSCGDEITKAFPKVDPNTGVIDSDAVRGFTREDVALLRAYAHGGADMRFKDLADRVEAALELAVDPSVAVQ